MSGRDGPSIHPVRLADRLAPRSLPASGAAGSLPGGCAREAARRGQAAGSGVLPPWSVRVAVAPVTVPPVTLLRNTQ